jgi:TetR/AcrR family transcriptional repressor of nem operon
MARPREFDEEQVLDAAMQLFWLKGYEATSLADLTSSMGLNKGSFYQAFGSKHELFLRTIRRYLDLNLKEIFALFADVDSAKEGVRRFLASYIGQFHRGQAVPRGCLAVNTVAELAPHDPDVAEILDRHFNREVSILTEEIRKDQRAGKIAADKDAEVLAQMVVVVAMGLLTGTKGPLKGIDDERLVDVVMLAFE